MPCHCIPLNVVTQVGWKGMESGLAGVHEISTKFLGYKTNEGNRYQADAIINPNDSGNNYSKLHFFAGAKKLKLLDYYDSRIIFWTKL